MLLQVHRGLGGKARGFRYVVPAADCRVWFQRRALQIPLWLAPRELAPHLLDVTPIRVPPHGPDQVLVRGLGAAALVPHVVVDQVLGVGLEFVGDVVPQGVLARDQPVHRLLAAQALAARHHALGRLGRVRQRVQVELARVQRGQVTTAQQRADEPRLGASDAPDVAGELAVVILAAGHGVVGACHSLRQRLRRVLHGLHLGVLLAERCELCAQVFHRLGVVLAAHRCIEVLLPHGRAQPLGERAFRPHLAARLGQLQAATGSHRVRQPAAPDAALRDRVRLDQIARRELPGLRLGVHLAHVIGVGRDVLGQLAPGRQLLADALHRVPLPVVDLAGLGVLVRRLLALFELDGFHSASLGLFKCRFYLVMLKGHHLIVVNIAVIPGLVQDRESLLYRFSVWRVLVYFLWAGRFSYAHVRWVHRQIFRDTRQRGIHPNALQKLRAQITALGARCYFWLVRKMRVGRVAQHRTGSSPPVHPIGWLNALARRKVHCAALRLVDVVVLGVVRATVADR